VEESRNMIVIVGTMNFALELLKDIPDCCWEFLATKAVVDAPIPVASAVPPEETHPSTFTTI
jgi:hypothetical protein